MRQLVFTLQADEEENFRELVRKWFEVEPKDLEHDEDLCELTCGETVILAGHILALRAGDRRLQWYYDLEGYYSYVLLNGSEAQFRELQEILEREGLKVLLAGRSYRPASDGRQYRWYIRVADETGGKPKRERIEKVLPAGTTQEEDIQKLRTALSAADRRVDAAERRYQAARERLEHAVRQYQALQKAHDERMRELQEYREKVGLLEAQLTQVRELGLKPEEIARMREEYEWIAQDRQRLAATLAKREDELNSLLNEFDRELEEKAQLTEKLTALKEQNDELLAENSRLVAKEEAVLQARRKGKPLKELFQSLIEVFLPNISFLRGSLDTLWHEVPDPVDVVRLLATLDRVKGKRVRSTEETGKWFERRFQGNWRLYYKRCDDERYKVLISHKGTQDADIEWLKSVDC